MKSYQATAAFLRTLGENTGIPLAPPAPDGGSVPVPPPVDTRIAQATTPLQDAIAQQAAIINQQSQVIQQQQSVLAAVPKMLSDSLALNNTQFVTPAVQAAFQAIVGGTSVQGLYTLQEVMQHLASDETGATQLLASQNADRSRFAALEPTVAGLSSNVTNLATSLATKAAAADVAALATTVASKAAVSDLTTLATTVGSKASATDLASLTAVVSGKASATDLTTQKTRLDTLTATTLPALQTDVSSRLLRAGDVATGSIMVPTATTAAAAPRLDQTYGGLNAPIRFVTAVGATATAMLPGPLTDPTPQGRHAKPYLVLLTMRSSPGLGLGTTITVGTTPGGAEVFSKTYLSTALPGLNAVLAPQSPIFADLPPGTTLYAKASAGTWDVEVLSYYKS